MTDYSSQIEKLQIEIKNLEIVLEEKRRQLSALNDEIYLGSTPDDNGIDNYSAPEEKIKLYRQLFRGREDVYAVRFESIRSGKSGYSPACAHEWDRAYCEKPKIKCSDCPNRSYLPVTDEVIKGHLLGHLSSSGYNSKPFVVGIYPLLQDEKCWFLAIDFDKKDWLYDVQAFMDTCVENSIPAYIERSRSGNGAHIWIFFDYPVPARIARNLGNALITQTLDKRPQLGLDSFDRFFPNQDTMPSGGFGNLIALPLQKLARDKNNSVFINTVGEPYKDQWLFLSSVKRLDIESINKFVQSAFVKNELLPVMNEAISEEVGQYFSAGKNLTYPEVQEVLPKVLEVTLSNQIYIDSTGLPPIIRNRILRIASFANPEFYKAQAIRLPTWNKPRILFCYDQHDSYIALPIGCLGDLEKLLNHYRIKPQYKDIRFQGKKLEVLFAGKLTAEQVKAAKELLKHDNGVLSTTTAFGKTVVALWLISQRNVNTLILVHRKQLMDQWVERISQFLSLSKKEIGRYGGGRKTRNGQLDVALIQSVSKGKEVCDWVGEYGMVIVDECHHISAFSFEQAVRKSSAKYKLGLSATVVRKDGQHPIIFMNLGSVRYSVNARQQLETKSFDHNVIIRETQFSINEELNASQNIQEVFKRIITDTLRNELVINDITQAVSEGRKILVLTERIEHLETLKDALSTLKSPLFVLKGGLGKKQVGKVMDGINNVESDSAFIVLSTGRYLGEGFDLPALDTLFLPFPISWKGTIVQYAGRLHREYHEKTEVRIYDYVDVKVPVLVRMHRRRMKGYNALGYKLKD